MTRSEIIAMLEREPDGITSRGLQQKYGMPSSARPVLSKMKVLGLVEHTQIPGRWEGIWRLVRPC